MPNNNPRGHNQYSKRKEENPNAAPPLPAGPSKRGFAAMDEETQREIASKGGQSQGRENNPGNFANDRERAREAGRKGGESHGSSK
jgi:general stress protein YciG